MSVLLDVRGATMHYGGVKALTDVSFNVRQGEFLGLIGPNGAGKTTMLKVITGQANPQSAAITLAGRDIGRLPTHRRMRMGLALTHQIVRPFKSMTLQDNVALAVGHHRIRHTLRALASIDRTEERRRAGELLALVGIGDQAGQPVTGQPLGVLKRLEVARALALEPILLLLDEPLAGLNNVEAGRLADTIAEINKRGLTIVMIEHNLGEVLRVSDRLVVLDNGRLIAQGEPRAVMRDPKVRAAYVGREETDAAA